MVLDFISPPSLLLCFVQVVKRLWSYIREHNLQDPNKKQNIICDESLRALFHVDRINMFQMNKALSKHIWPLNTDDGIFLYKLWHTLYFSSHRKEIYIYIYISPIAMYHVSLITFLMIWEGNQVMVLQLFNFENDNSLC